MNILREGTPARKKLDALELRAKDLRGKISFVADAPRPVDEVLEEVRRSLQLASENCAGDSVIRSIRGHLSPHREFRGEASIALTKQPLTLLDMFALIGGDDLCKRLRPCLAHDHPGMPAAERAAELENLRAQLKAAEVDAECEALRLEKEGHTVLRCEDADPAVLFEVWANAT
jgi:hypothetical protein